MTAPHHLLQLQKSAIELYKAVTLQTLKAHCRGGKAGTTSALGPSHIRSQSLPHDLFYSSPRQAIFNNISAQSVLQDLSITDDMLLQLQPWGEGFQATPLTDVTLPSESIYFFILRPESHL